MQEKEFHDSRFGAQDTASNAVALIKRQVTFENKTETQQKGNRS
jgi:hypothetical protein